MKVILSTKLSGLYGESVTLVERPERLSTKARKWQIWENFVKPVP
jgi:hypothetical protein